MAQDTNSIQYAQHMARYGHKDWLWWRDTDGRHTARKTPENVKRMLLAVGTQGSWTLISANDGCLLRGFWSLGINLLAHMKRGDY